MQLSPGMILVHKVSGQYAVIVDVNETTVGVRMAKETKNDGTDYVHREFSPNELETAEEHLKRELGEMELRRDMLDAAEERHTQKKLDKLPSPKIAGDIKVN